MPAEQVQQFHRWNETDENGMSSMSDADMLAGSKWARELLTDAIDGIGDEDEVRRIRHYFQFETDGANLSPKLTVDALIEASLSLRALSSVQLNRAMSDETKEEFLRYAAWRTSQGEIHPLDKVKVYSHLATESIVTYDDFLFAFDPESATDWEKVRF